MISVVFNFSFDKISQLILLDGDFDLENRLHIARLRPLEKKKLKTFTGYFCTSLSRVSIVVAHTIILPENYQMKLQKIHVEMRLISAR